MSVTRLPTPESALAELTATLAERGCLPLPVAHELLSNHLGLDDASYVLNEARRTRAWSAQCAEVAGILLHVPTLARGRVFTHRLTEDEVAADELDLTLDAPPLVRVLAGAFVATNAQQQVSAAVGRPRRLARPHDAHVLRLPGGFCEAAGWSPGTLLALRLMDAPVAVLPTAPDRPNNPHNPHDPRPTAPQLAIDVLDDQPEDQSFADVLASDYGSFIGMTEVDGLIMRTLHLHPGLLREPAAPLSESLATRGLNHPTADVVQVPDEAWQMVRESFTSRLATTYHLADPDASLLLDTFVWLAHREAAITNQHIPSILSRLGRPRGQAAPEPTPPTPRPPAATSPTPSPPAQTRLAPRPPQSTQLAPEPTGTDAAAPRESTHPDFVEEIDAALRDPGWARALANEATVAYDAAHALAELADRPSRGQPKTTRIGRLYLAGRAAEALGQPLAAAAHYREADRLGDAPHALHRLAGIERDRGDFRAAAWLLDRAATDPMDPLAVQVRSALRTVNVGAPDRPPGRNEPCWCGSDRKYKVCHGRSGPAGPLSERAWMLYSRLTWFLSDVTPDAVDQLENIAWAATNGAELPADYLHPFVVDVLLGEGGTADLFRRQRGEVLPSDEAHLLDAWLTTTRELYEVADITPGHWFDLRHLLTGTVTRIADAHRGENLQRGTLVCARLLDMGGERVPLGEVPVSPNTRAHWAVVLLTNPRPRHLVKFWASQYAEPPELNVEGHLREVCVGVLTTDAPATLARALDTLFSPMVDSRGTPAGPQKYYGTWEFSERVPGPRGHPLWSEAVSIDLFGSELTIVAWSRERYERTIAALGNLPTALTEAAFHTCDPHTFVHPIWGTYDDEDDDWLGGWDDDEVYDLDWLAAVRSQQPPTSARRRP